MTATAVRHRIARALRRAGIDASPHQSRHGYATMRVDKSGMGDSKGTPCMESDFEMEASGYKAGLAAIKGLDFVDQQNIFIAGFSIGGIMAPVVAQGGYSKRSSTAE